MRRRGDVVLLWAIGGFFVLSAIARFWPFAEYLSYACLGLAVAIAVGEILDTAITAWRQR